jgi:hypothetical protein
VLTLLLPLIVVLLRIEGLPWQEKNGYLKPKSSMSQSYFDVLEQNSHIIYPAIAVLTLALIIVGLLQAWKNQDMDLKTRVEYKRAILTELRRHLNGLPGDELARTLALDRLKMVKLLEQMQEEGMVQSHTNSKRITVWRVRGANTEPAASRYA